MAIRAAFAGSTIVAAPQQHFSPGDHRRARASWRTLLCAAIAIPSVSFAAPLVLEETARITLPDPAYSLSHAVAVEGDTIIATGARFDGELQTNAAFLFRRQANGQWAYARTLASGSCDSGEVGEETCTASASIRNGVAVVAVGRVHVFTRATDGSWVEAPSTGSAGPGDVAVGTNAFITGEANSCVWSSQVFRPDSAGMWSPTTTFPVASYPGCDPWTLVGHDVDASEGNRFILGRAEFGSPVAIYEPAGGGWTQTASLVNPASELFGEAVAIDDERAFVSDSESGVHVYSRSTGAWPHATTLLPPDAAQRGAPRSIKVQDLVAVGYPYDRFRGGSVGLFRESASGDYEEVARLVGSDSANERAYLGGEVDAFVDNGFARVVATASNNTLYVFDLNHWGTTPAALQHNFELGNAGGWTPMAGSTFSVVSAGGTKVYRQASVAGDAGSFVTTIDWTNQAIEADVRPTAFDGANRWVGLAVRRTDANNYYYLALRQSNVLEIKRMVNGSFVTLVAAPVPVVLNRNYRLRLEAIGTLLRAYVNGKLMLEVHDTALTHGHAGVRMYRARADFDNVVLSQNPYRSLHDQHKDGVGLWQAGPGNWTLPPNGAMSQLDTSGDARIVHRIPADDQIVQASIHLTSFAAGSGNRWFGLVARYTDAGNYYYVTTRNNQTISLRKLVNGAVHVIDTTPLAVAVGGTYSLRLEAIGNSLRVYVNGNLVLEASDTSHPSGSYGAAMYKATVAINDFLAWEP